MSTRLLRLARAAVIAAAFVIAGPVPGGMSPAGAQNVRTLTVGLQYAWAHRPPGRSMLGSRITSSFDEPAATIGYTFSR